MVKVHKQLVNVCPPFRPILSAIGAPADNIPKLLVPNLKIPTICNHTLKGTFELSSSCFLRMKHFISSTKTSLKVC